MRRRVLFPVSLLGACLSVAAFPSTAGAALRAPQVPVLGGALQRYFTSVGEISNVGTDQDAAQRWSSSQANNTTFTIQVELGPKVPGVSAGLYNAGAPAPVLYELFPSDAVQGWFAVASFRSNPTRVVITLFDSNAAVLGTATHPGADKADFAFYLSGPEGMFYTQDDRNPGGGAQWLAYAATGIMTGSWWIAGEEASVAAGASDRDYDDVVLFYERSSCLCTDVQRTSWGTLKTRFR